MTSMNPLSLECKKLKYIFDHTEVYEKTKLIGGSYRRSNREELL